MSSSPRPLYNAIAPRASLSTGSYCDSRSLGGSGREPKKHAMIQLFGGRIRVAKAALALVAFAAIVGAAAWLLGWFSSEAAQLGVVLIVVIALAGAVLLQRQAAQRNSAIAALRNAEARVSQIVEAAMDPVISVDAEQRIILFNAAAERVFQWPRNAVLGQRLDMQLEGYIQVQGRSIALLDFEAMRQLSGVSPNRQRPVSEPIVDREGELLVA